LNEKEPKRKSLREKKKLHRAKPKGNARGGGSLFPNRERRASSARKRGGEGHQKEKRKKSGRKGSSGEKNRHQKGKKACRGLGKNGDLKRKRGKSARERHKGKNALPKLWNVLKGWSREFRGGGRAKTGV